MTIESTIATMSTEEKVGQMFMLAFAGDQLDEARILMQQHLVGGAYISDENVPTAAAALQASAIPCNLSPRTPAWASRCCWALTRKVPGRS